MITMARNLMLKLKIEYKIYKRKEKQQGIGIVGLVLSICSRREDITHPATCHRS